MESILKVDKIEKYYGSRSSLTKAIDNLSFEVDKGEFVAIMGASGSGKTTLLNVISTIDNVTSGHIYVAGVDITKLKGNELNRFRREELGFIFQDFNLLDTLTAYENIALSLSIQNVSAKEIDTKIKKVAEELDIKDVLKKYPYQMSGGQKQRSSIARALLKNAPILILDDSLSAVDTDTEERILENLGRLRAGKTTIIIEMTKADIVNEIAKSTGIDKATVLTTLEAFMDTVKGSLSNDENVYLRGFGSFIVKKRAQKTARNISKNTTIIIPEHNIPAFKPAKTFTLSVKK